VHDESILEFIITNHGIAITGAMSEYVDIMDIMTGVAQKIIREYQDREAAIERTEEGARKKKLEDFEAMSTKWRLKRRSALLLLSLRKTTSVVTG
jgi:hypothetical protein